MSALLFARRTIVAAAVVLTSTSGCWVVAGLEDRSPSDGLGDAGRADGPPPDSDTPPGCDAAKDPKDAPCLLADLAGVFVSPNGDDAADGTKAKPLRRIGAAVQKAHDAGKTRVFVCEGTYDEALVLDVATDGVSLFGGFACADFAYTGVRPRVAPTAAGYALRVDGRSKQLRIQDFEIVARDAQAPGESSIGALVKSTQSAAFKRVKIAAGNGMKGADGAPPPTNHLTPASLQANANPNTTSGTQPTTCTCPLAGTGTSTGGHGGQAVGLPQTGGAGTAMPIDPGWAISMTGKGGTGNPPDCSNAGTGNPGGAGVPGGAGAASAAGAPADRVGAITANGWQPSEAGAGSPGKPGQGGGGGAANNNLGGAPVGGGGGGCGSCGGAGGTPGRPGGSSIAVLVFDAGVSFAEACVLVAASGGDGGTGAAGEDGRVGGNGGAGNDPGFDCSGGVGGPGAGGSGGAGGTGGLSVGIAYSRGAPPMIDGVAVQATDVHPAIATSVAGAGGGGGPGGKAAASGFGAVAGNVGAPGNTGLAAVAKAVLVVP